jgi:hypothetical protein
MNYNTTTNLLKDLGHLIEAAELLDNILSYYKIYDGQFDKIPDYDAEIGRRNNLMDKIRTYLDFDDSE